MTTLRSTERRESPLVGDYDLLAASSADSLAGEWVRLLRCRQWVKNGFVIAPLLFSGRADDPWAIGWRRDA